MQQENTNLTQKGEFMQEQYTQMLFAQVKEAIKNFKLKEGDFITFSDENHQLRVSPYRMTMEIRFPENSEQIEL